MWIWATPRVRGALQERRTAGLLLLGPNELRDLKQYFNAELKYEDELTHIKDETYKPAGIDAKFKV